LNNKIYYLLFSAALLFAISAQQCLTPENKQLNSPFQNVYDTSVHYVGMETCKGCHQDVYNTFMQTGMGKSWGLATQQKSAARFGAHEVVYDSLNDLYYHPYWSKETLYIQEYRLQGTDTVHNRIEKVSYIVGSGQHTNSHIINTNGYLFQAPITFYTQKQIWGLAPGFEKGSNSKFNRIIGQECMTCHNHLPETDGRADNHFTTIKQGIECERCHGPGSLHVAEKQAGKLIDIKTATDYTIVNPRKLSRDLQVDLCQRCHLQGITVLKDGKKFSDFRPGMRLTEIMHTFIPRYTDSTTHFIMASHADRMKMSKCFKKSEMTCLSCHNPHVSVTVTPKEVFNEKCNSCHTSKTTICNAPMEARNKVQNNCVQCHLPLSGSIDIPNVQIHDHYIRKPLSAAAKKEIGQFVRLADVSTSAAPAPIVEAEAYLNFYEEYVSANYFLTIAGQLLDKCSAEELPTKKLRIRYWFLKKEYASILQLATSENDKKDNWDAWTAYRIGESCLQLHQVASAIGFFEMALAKQSGELDFINKLGIAYLQNNENEKALACWEKVLLKNPSHVSALTNYGYAQTLRGNLKGANQYYEKALAINPDYEQALLNMAALQSMLQNKKQALGLLRHLIKLNPSNKEAQMRFQQLQKVF